jgi:PEP-CTERM motif-containing protein
MKISNTMFVALVPAMVSLAPVAARATAPTVTVFNSTALNFGGPVVLTINGVGYDAFTSGHYDNLGDQISTNYQAGFDGFNNNPLSEVRNYFVFDLSDLIGAITSATLAIQSNPFGIGYENTSGSASITYTNWDVSTSVDDLEGGINGLSTFADLGSGEKFGSALVHQGDLITTVTLDAAALDDIAAAEGKDFAVGGSAMATVPEASTWAMMIAGFGLMGIALRRRLKTIAFA